MYKIKDMENDITNNLESIKDEKHAYANGVRWALKECLEKIKRLAV